MKRCGLKRLNFQMINDMSKENKTSDVMWRFCAYRTNKDYESGDHYFVKDFLDHTEMKVFSGEHSAKEKPLYPDYCSMYWKIETNATNSETNTIATRITNQ